MTSAGAPITTAVATSTTPAPISTVTRQVSGTPVVVVQPAKQRPMALMMALFGVVYFRLVGKRMAGGEA